MLNLSRMFGAEQVRMVEHGHLVQDAYLEVEAIEFPDQRVVFRVGKTYFYRPTGGNGPTFLAA